MNSFKCEFCNKNYSTLSNLNKHLKQAKFCKNSYQNNKQKNINTEEVKNKYNCIFCNKNFINEFSLNNHTQKCKYKTIFNEVAKQTKEENLKLKNELFETKLQLDQKTKLINNLNYNMILEREEDDQSFINSELYIEYLNFCNIEIDRNILIQYLVSNFNNIDNKNSNNIIKLHDILSIEKEYQLKFINYLNYLSLHFTDNNILSICLKIETKNNLIDKFINNLFKNESQYLLSFFNKCISLLRELNLKNEISMDEFSLHMYKIVTMYQYISDNFNNNSKTIKIEF